MWKSINKTTVIIVLAVFLTLSVGYALFSDTITIEGTATAQGNFDIEATCYTEIPEEILEAYVNVYGTLENLDIGYSDESCVVSDDKNTVTYSVSLDYPGAIKWYVVKLSNIGTIDAKLPLDFVDDLGYVEVKTYNSETKELIKTERTDKSFISGANGILAQTKEGTYMGADETIFDAESESFLLRTGANWYLFFKAEWVNYEKYTQNGVYYEAKQTLTFPFEQFANK